MSTIESINGTDSPSFEMLSDEKWFQALSDKDKLKMNISYEVQSKFFSPICLILGMSDCHENVVYIYCSFGLTVVSHLDHLNLAVSITQ